MSSYTCGCFVVFLVSNLTSQLAFVTFSFFLFGHVDFLLLVSFGHLIYFCISPVSFTNASAFS